MEEVNTSELIVTTYPGGIRNKTIELQREVFDKFNIQKYPKIGFGTSMPAMEFQNLLWIMNGCDTKDVNPDFARQVKETAKSVVKAEVLFFISSNVIPLKEDSIEFIFNRAREGKIVNFSLYEGIALSKETYEKMNCPNLKDLFTVARKHKVEIETLRVSQMDGNGCKIYSWADKELFWQVGGDEQEKKYWDKCEEVLVRGMYEDRSIKH